MRIVAVDIGGTHARFALAELSGSTIVMGPETVLRTGDFGSLAQAWAAYGPASDVAGAAIAVAGPVEGAEIRLTNNSWVLRRDRLKSELGIDRVHLVNDFAAVAHAVPSCADQLLHVSGPNLPLPAPGVISVVGPGTGLGVALLHRLPHEDRVIATEGGHIGFAPTDALENRILQHLCAKHGRVSIERVVCGQGLTEIHAILTGEEADDRGLWTRALAGDPDVAESLNRYCGLLGAAAGDIALAHGASSMVLAGGLGLKLAEVLPHSSFGSRFCAKGRFAGRMAQLPVKLIAHPQPGLLGAAAAFAALYGA